MNNPPSAVSVRRAPFRPTTAKPAAVTAMASSREISVSAKSYATGIVIWNASMAMKCIDQMPPPMATEAAAIHAQLDQPVAIRIRPPRSSAV